eukprot:7078730-Ditylum_brightwellii.AAC.1
MQLWAEGRNPCLLLPTLPPLVLLKSRNLRSVSLHLVVLLSNGMWTITPPLKSYLSTPKSKKYTPR